MKYSALSIKLNEEGKVILEEEVMFILKYLYSKFGNINCLQIMKSQGRHQIKEKRKSFAEKREKVKRPKRIIKSHMKNEYSVDECLKMIDILTNQNKKFHKEFIREKTFLWRQFSFAVRSHWDSLIQTLKQNDNYDNSSSEEGRSFSSRSGTLTRMVPLVNKMISFRFESQTKLQELFSDAIKVENKAKKEVTQQKNSRRRAQLIRIDQQ